MHTPQIRRAIGHAYITIHKPTSDSLLKPMMRKKVWLVVRVAPGQSGGGEKQKRNNDAGDPEHGSSKLICKREANPMLAGARAADIYCTIPLVSRRNTSSSFIWCGATLSSAMFAATSRSIKKK